MSVLAIMVGTLIFFRRSVDMKHISIPQVRPITGNTPQEAAMLFNEAIRELAPMHPQWTREGDTYYITYMVAWDEAETLAEEHELKGEKHKCEECPYCVRDLNRFGEVDRRKKWATCASTGERVLISESVCDIYYKGKEDA